MITRFFCLLSFAISASPLGFQIGQEAEAGEWWQKNEVVKAMLARTDETSMLLGDRNSIAARLKTPARSMSEDARFGMRCLLLSSSSPL